MIFETDHDSSGWSVEIYAAPDANGDMEYLGRLDLFSRLLIRADGRPFTIPDGFDRSAVETWAAGVLS